jgi:hypothetical protein
VQSQLGEWTNSAGHLQCESRIDISLIACLKCHLKVREEDSPTLIQIFNVASCMIIIKIDFNDFMHRALSTIVIISCMKTTV